ncbi:MAG: hypothetical protein AAB329_07525 [Pseudomonadota bacterium]
MNTRNLMLSLAVAFTLSAVSAAFTAPARADNGDNKSVKEQIKDDVKKDVKKKGKQKLKDKLKGDKKEEGK